MNKNKKASRRKFPFYKPKNKEGKFGGRVDGGRRDRVAVTSSNVL